MFGGAAIHIGAHGAVNGYIEVVDHIDGVNIVDKREFLHREVARHQHQRTYNQAKGGIFAMSVDEATREWRVIERHHAPEHYGHIYHHHKYHCRQYAAELLAGFIHIGGHQVEKHIHGKYRLAVHIEKHYLKGIEEHKQEHYVEHLARALHQGHHHPPDAHRQHHIAHSRYQRRRLGEKQYEVG